MHGRKFLIIGLALLAGLLLVSPLALADTLDGSPGGAWTAAPVPNNSGSPFWNYAGDGPGNVGFILLSTDPSRGLPVPNLQYWSIGGAVDSNVVFNNAASGQAETLIVTYAGNAGINQLLAYDIANPSNTVSIFNGQVVIPPTLPVSVTVNIPSTWTQYGFELIGSNGTTFYSGSAAPGGTSYGNFAFFQNADLAGTYWVGVEDLPLGGADKDYNDLVFRVTTVPLPPSALLLGTGLLGLGLLGRRRRKTQG